MTPAEFITIGQHLYGPSWKRPLAAKLEIEESTVGRYARAKHPVPLPIRKKLVSLLVKQESEARDLRRAIRLSA